MTVRMTSKPLIEESKIEETIKSKPKEAFTVRDLIETLTGFTLKSGTTREKVWTPRRKKKVHSFNVPFKQV
jgi:hypothetical protein